MEKQTEVQAEAQTKAQKGIWEKEALGRAYQPSGICLTRAQTPLSVRAMEAIRELKSQDMSSYLYLLMEGMLFATAEGLCREQGNMAETVRRYLAEFYKRELSGTKE